jgi:hypothetical protein
MVQCYLVPDSCVPEQNVSDLLSHGQCVPWTMRPLNDASLGRYVPWTMRSAHTQTICGRLLKICCRMRSVHF